MGSPFLYLGSRVDVPHRGEQWGSSPHTCLTPTSWDQSTGQHRVLAYPFPPQHLSALTHVHTADPTPANSHTSTLQVSASAYTHTCPHYGTSPSHTLPHHRTPHIAIHIATPEPVHVVDPRCEHCSTPAPHTHTFTPQNPTHVHTVHPSHIQTTAPPGFSVLILQC